MIIKYYSLVSNGLLDSNHQTLNGAKKALAEKMYFFQYTQRTHIENMTPMSFDADWYGGHAHWEIVEITLELQE